MISILCCVAVQWPVFPLEEKNLLNPRECFSGVGVDEVEDPELVGMCTGFFDTGDLWIFPSVSDVLYGALYRFEGDPEPSLE